MRAAQKLRSVNDKEESEQSPLFSFKYYYFTLFSKLRMEKEVISPTADQRESKSWNQCSKESSSLPVNPSAPSGIWS